MSASTVWFEDRYLDGAEVPIPHASLTVTQGLGAYETLRLVSGRARWIERHVRRLARTARALGLKGVDRDWSAILAELARRNGVLEGRARVTLGDGFALATCGPLPPELDRERTRGVALVTADVVRPNPTLKCTARAPLLLAERVAGGEVLLRDAGGGGLESSRSNLFAWRDAALWTAPAHAVLPGIAREVVLERALALGIRVVERPIPPELFATPGELFVTNSLRGVRPVARVDERPHPIGARTLEMQRELDESASR